MTHPGDDSGFRPAFDRNCFCAGNSTAADGGRVTSNSSGHSLCQMFVSRVEIKKRNDGVVEIVNIVSHNTFYANAYGVATFEKNIGVGGGTADVTNSLFAESRYADVFIDELSVNLDGAWNNNRQPQSIPSGIETQLEFDNDVGGNFYFVDTPSGGIKYLKVEAPDGK